MQVIEAHPTRMDAVHAKEAYVAAQRMVDRVISKLIGAPVEPPAEQVYFVIEDGKQYVVAFEDPSFEARAEPSERVYDCGD